MLRTWTIASFPELRHLDERDRADLLRRIRHRWVTFRLIVLALILGAAGGALAGVAAMGSSGEIAALAPWLAGTAGVAVAVGVYQLTLLAIRARLRNELMDAFEGEQLPCCLRCGYDVGKVRNARCPECNAPIRVPRP